MEGSLRQAVQHLLRPTDTCVHAVQGRLLGVSGRAERLCAVVKHEARQEHALFIFSVDYLNQPPCHVLEAFYPIRGHFSAHTQVTKDGWNQVLVATGDGSSLVLSLSADHFTRTFISQLNKASKLFTDVSPTAAQSTGMNSKSAFDWLRGYEGCCTGWDRFSRPGQPPSSSQSTSASEGERFGGTGQPLCAAFPEQWPWSHIITPNSDGSTDIATCENDMSEFDPLSSKPESLDPVVTMETIGITVTDPSPTAVAPPTQNPFESPSTNPFSNSPPANPSGPFRDSFVMIRSCTSDSNLPHLETETARHQNLRGEPLITRSTEDLISGDEVERHCVAGLGRDGLAGVSGGSTPSLSDGGQESGDVGEGGEGQGSLAAPHTKSKRRWWRDKVERKSVSAGERYSHFEVITDNEIKGSQGRQRLDGSRDPHDLRKKRDKILLERLRRPSGSRPGVSKANMDQPELASKLTSSLKVTSSRWVSRYRPGVPVPMPNARESIVQAELRHRERDFCDRMKLRVFCGTWNVNGKLPTCSLDEWLLHHQGEGEGGSGIKPDIYAIGFQELDLSAQALMGVESGREEPWINAVEVSLKKAGPYHKLLHTRLVGIMLLVYITPQLLDAVSDQFVEYVTTGIGGVLGNKGGVGARFNLFHSSLCFVNCHFAASMEEVDKRNHDYHTIRNKMLFDKIQDYKYTIMDHDMVFWLGDMNYRIQTSEVMTVEVIKAHADTFQISSLLKQDQLVQEMTKGNIFTEFAEGAINFKPTYKYDVNSDNWDTSEKHRPPAWCDRVLYYGMGAELRGYHSHPELKISDHKPVSAVFNCDVRVVDTVKERDILEEITRKLDKLENDILPQVDLSATEFTFTDVKFQVAQSRRLIVTNTGRRPVLVSFIPKLDDETYCRPWMQAKPSSAVVQPLQDVEIVLTVCVDCDTASTLSGHTHIEDILVLHLEGGKDFFISLSGNYLPSCFGSSLETLVHLHTYIREVPTAELLDLSLSSSWDHINPPSPSPSTSPRAPSPSTPLTTPPHDIPKELFQMVSYLNTHALTQENLFQEGGRQVEMEEIRNVLDVGGARELPGSTHSVANCLLLFLSALSEPVIPVPLHQRVVECCNQPMLCKQLLLHLPRVHQRTFTFLVSFMKRLLSHSEENGLDPKLLATIFGDILMRAPVSERHTRSKKQLGPLSRKKATFLYQFLVNDLTVDYR